MTVRVFGYLILALIFTILFLFSPQFYIRVRRYVKHSRQCLTTIPNTLMFVKNPPLRVLLLTFLVFRNVVKNSLSCFMYYC